jgi:hypothetical protein
LPALAHCFPRSFTFYVTHPTRSILSEQFLAEVRGLKYIAVELLEKLLGDEIRFRSKRNIVQSGEFSAVTDAQQRPGFPIVNDIKKREPIRRFKIELQTGLAFCFIGVYVHPAILCNAASDRNSSHLG